MSISPFWFLTGNLVPQVCCDNDFFMTEKRLVKEIGGERRE
jgi:hypothetical protein